MNAPCRVAVLSSTEFGRRCAEVVAALPDTTLAGILTTPARIPISYSERPITLATHAEFSELAGRTGCALFVLSSRPVTADYLARFEEWRPDLVLALGWYYMVPQRARAWARLGCLGIHASLLPKYRGGAPIPWALINGETETGVTLFHLTDAVDAGDIVAQRAFPIAAHESCADVIAHATDASLAMLREQLPIIAAAQSRRIPQRHEHATVMPQRSPADGVIDWARPAVAAYNFIRAQTRPYPGAFTFLDGRKVVIWAARLAPRPARSAPGTVSVEDGAVWVSCLDGALQLTEASFDDGSGRTADALAVLGRQPASGSFRFAS